MKIFTSSCLFLVLRLLIADFATAQDQNSEKKFLLQNVQLFDGKRT